MHDTARELSSMKARRAYTSQDKTPRLPRRETIDSVMAMLGLSCRREVEASLDSPSNELSLPCKQEVQNALSGFSHVRWRRPRHILSEKFTLARRTSTPARCRASPRRPES